MLSSTRQLRRHALALIALAACAPTPAAANAFPSGPIRGATDYPSGPVHSALLDRVATLPAIDQTRRPAARTRAIGEQLAIRL